MVISQIKMGLGNQLFQYAAGLSLANYLNVPLILDTSSYQVIFDPSSYQEDCSREFCLNYFEIDDIKTEIETDSGDDVCFDYYEEPHFHFDQNFFKKSSFTYLSGFWQTEKYFKNIKPEIRKRFSIKGQYIQHLKIDELAFLEYQSVNLHIRRTDYAIYTSIGIQPLDYYYKAIYLLKQRHENLRFYIFSDDIDWVQQNLKLDGLNHVFVSNIYTKTNIEDFYLMQQCKHHIIANSTFSWWAAWLCSYNKKQVIAPAKWFLNRPHADTMDLVPAGWIKIE